ncbi:probable receptor-like serine/threonine-protein kinase At4g34500 [Macadamia integrifolia]|uniref:probable receptor-like serine/threonine-protein kinase At4g34500 n=1 Tax=Macadamia integrifolia TaxID=60698 RepID=UPI001C4E8D80|nr:probable receptor-like serine/threonine-protein kinase At4g34500 [Macadamia integrifolia]
MASNTILRKLTARTSPFGLRLYIVMAISVGCLIAVVLLVLLCFRSFRSSKKRRKCVKHTSAMIPIISKDIAVIKASDRTGNGKIGGTENKEREDKDFVHADAGKSSETGNRSTETDVSGGSQGSSSAVSIENPNIGWGQWYALRELEIATRGFSDENVIGEGGYGIVYRGVMPDNSVVAVKNLINNKGQAEKEFKVEVEAIGKVRHKNLVGLIGYCVEGAQRMLVYEYVENGNLEQWLHGDVGSVSPLTWDIRLKIAIGTAKGLAYLHEGLEPKVVHRDIKSSNILLDKQWNPKVSDFGLAKLLGSDASYVTTRVMGTFGYVAPEYASTGMLSEGSDVYSFGILLMEIITGRSPVDYGRPPGEVNLVEWFKGMVTNRRGEELVDPLIEVQPSPRALKRVLLVCLRCIDMDANKRPKMGQVVHMLEADEFPFRSVEPRTARDGLPPRAGPAAMRNSIPNQAYHKVR